MSKEVLERLLEKKVIAIVREISGEDIVALARALKMGGVSCIEVTFDQTSPEKEKLTAAAIRSISSEFGEGVCVGAGTVMTPGQVDLAAEAGAEYIISPNVDEEVIRRTKQLGLVSLPGAFTPSEIALAYKYGADVVKVFPAGELGPSYIRSVKAPLRHIPLFAVGGVNVQNCGEFLKAGVAGIGVGGNLVSAKLVAEGRFDEITALAREYMEAVR